MMEQAPSSTIPGNGSSLVATARLVRVYARGLVAWVIFCLVLATLYLIWAPSEYTANSQIILQPRRPTVVTQSSDNQIPQTLDTPQIDSQIEVIGSQRVLQPVFDALDLRDNPEFNKQQVGLSSLVKSWLLGAHEDGKPDYLALADRVSARRVGQSLVLGISVRASKADLAAKLANSVTASFLREEIEAKLTDVERNGDWLQSRVEDIRKQLAAATDAMRTGSPTMGPFSASDARILTTASVPSARSSPKPTLTLAFTIALALASGFAFVALRKGFDQRVWSVEQAMATTGLNCITTLPAVALPRKPRNRLSVSVDRPWTEFARRIRVVRDTLLRHANRSGMVVGIASARGGAGASTFAANLACAIARAGTPCVLVDGDLQSPHLTRTIAPDASDTLLQCLYEANCKATPIRQASGMLFLPARRTDQEPPADLYLGMPRLGEILRDLAANAIVIVDLPPLNMGADATSLSAHADGVILLVREGNATTDEVWSGVNAMVAAQVPLFGLVYSSDTRAT